MLDWSQSGTHPDTSLFPQTFFSILKSSSCTSCCFRAAERAAALRRLKLVQWRLDLDFGAMRREGEGSVRGDVLGSFGFELVEGWVGLREGTWGQRWGWEWA